MKNISKVFAIIAFVVVICFSLATCESMADILYGFSQGVNEANNYNANSYSSSSETGMVYTIYNRSSQTVTLYDYTGSVSIRSGGSATARFNSSASIYDVSYYPSSLKVTQSGYSFTFTD